MPELFRRKRLPYGFTFLNTKETKELHKKSAKVESILANADYKPITPASIDFKETFQVFGRDDIFTLKDHLGDDLSLRNDVTVQVMKGFSNQLGNDFLKKDIFRYYYNVSIFTDIKKNYPLLREVQQLGAELIGLKSEKAIEELILIADKILKFFFESNYRILIGDIRIFYLFQENFKASNLKKLILNKNAPKLGEIITSFDWDPDIAFQFAQALLFFTGKENLLEPIQKKMNRQQKEFLAEFKNKFNILKAFTRRIQKKGIPLIFEPLLVRRPEYYSGFLFEGYVPDLSFPPLRGGSYDFLMKEYSNHSMPASGFALDISSIMY